MDSMEQRPTREAVSRDFLNRLSVPITHPDAAKVWLQKHNESGNSKAVVLAVDLVNLHSVNSAFEMDGGNEYILANLQMLVDLLEPLNEIAEYKIVNAGGGDEFALMVVPKNGQPIEDIYEILAEIEKTIRLDESKTFKTIDYYHRLVMFADGSAISFDDLASLLPLILNELLEGKAGFTPESIYQAPLWVNPGMHTKLTMGGIPEIFSDWDKLMLASGAKREGSVLWLSQISPRLQEIDPWASIDQAKGWLEAAKKDGSWVANRDIFVSFVIGAIEASRKFLKNTDQTKVLVIACGDGRDTRAVIDGFSDNLRAPFKRGDFSGLSKVEFTCIDINPLLIANANAENEHRTFVKFHIGDATNLPVPDNYFDVIQMYVSLHDIADLNGVLSEINKVSKNGTKVVISFLNPYETMDFLQLPNIQDLTLEYMDKTPVDIQDVDWNRPFKFRHRGTKPENKAIYEGYYRPAELYYSLFKKHGLTPNNFKVCENNKGILTVEFDVGNVTSNNGQSQESIRFFDTHPRCSQQEPKSPLGVTLEQSA